MRAILVDPSAGARGFWPCNPSVVGNPDGMWLSVRLVNYKLDTRHRPPYRSHTLFTRLPDEGPILLTPDNSVLLKEPPGEKYQTLSYGLEDLRLMPGPGIALRAIGCACDRSMGCMLPQQATFWVAPQTGDSGGLQVHSSPLVEKNWVPILGFPHDEQHYIYSLRPWTVIIRESLGGRMREAGRYFYLDGQATQQSMLSGSTQAITFQDGYLLLAHERYGRVYRHRWVKLSGDLRPVAQSKPFYFRFVGVEFACGLAWAPPVFEDPSLPEKFTDPGPRLLVTFGVHDDEAWIASINAEEVSACLA
jgi:hypothetical protein